MLRRFARYLVFILTLVMALPAVAALADTPKNQVYVIHIDEMRSIDPTLALYVRRSFAKAAADPTTAGVAIVIDTPGGRLDSVLEIKDAILEHRSLKTVAFVRGNAWSAGALVATASQKLYMRDDATIGAAEPRLEGSTAPADPKTMSAVVAAFRSAAEARGRDPEIAQAMVDKSKRIPGQTTDMLVLTAKQAVDQKYADGLAANLDDALRQAGIAEFHTQDLQPSLSDQLARLLTTPWVAVLLLVVGVIALGVEFMKPGLTVPGAVGVTALGLFFAGNVLAGTAGWLEIALAAIGIVLLVIEAFVPGHGVFGIGGVIAVGLSVFLAVPDTSLAVIYLGSASGAFAVAMIFFLRGISERGLGKALTLGQSAQGWVPAKADRTELIGREGQALTVLRPAGIAQFGAEKVDVVTEGDFVSQGATVRVIRVEGTRIVVRVVKG